MILQLARVVPRVAPARPIVLTSVLAGAFVLGASSAPSAATRVRIAAALVAAVACCVLDDDAATTLAATPVPRRVQRAVRVGVASAFVVAWLAVVEIAADALTGVGSPPLLAVMEVGTLALIAFAVACVAIGRTDDGRGGVAGVLVALLCFATVYLPPRWWWPLTAQPETVRLAVISVIALAVALTASVDPARRLPRLR